ncbi:PaaI family thioesterase [Maribellus sp. CM-23]|uniref:PaaI family thioesterase n=1 Tax=Maribellus sp. CM-23 TaxID=2781026 RepID=UPI001F418354|nr:PaaI family thioesterase [Maribellus sp. CM-23]MCE4565112.1 PaaI family thioesterase [Maribellus sp. CM-23]
MTIEEINKLCQNTLIGHLDIEFLSYGEDFVEARMLVDQKKWQPAGLLHGGASLALAETVASGGSMLLVDPTQFNVLGLQVSGNHISTISEGFVLARAEIVHRGNKTHVWDVKITSSEGKLISVARVTNMIIEKKQKRD